MDRSAEIRYFGVQLARRAVAALWLYSGLLEKKWHSALQRGQAPWRILRYQRVLEPEGHFYPLSVNKYIRPKTFEMQLKYLARQAHVIALDDLLEKLESESPIPDKTIVLTFDDGYIDTYETAFPLLKKYGLPATVFLPTSFIGSMNLFWREKVIVSLFFIHQEGIPIHKIPVIDQYFPDTLPDQVLADEVVFNQIFSFANFLETLPREELTLALLAIGEVVTQLGGYPQKRDFVSWDEVRKMAQEGISFGSMGHSHQLAMDLTAEQFGADLRASYEQLQAEKVPFSKVYCYPEGFVDLEKQELLGKLGVKHSLGIALDEAKKQPPSGLLPRLPLIQDQVFAKELFACVIWDS